MMYLELPHLGSKCADLYLGDPGECQVSVSFSCKCTCLVVSIFTFYHFNLSNQVLDGDAGGLALCNCCNDGSM